MRSRDELRHAHRVGVVAQDALAARFGHARAGRVIARVAVKDLRQIVGALIDGNLASDLEQLAEPSLRIAELKGASGGNLEGAHVHALAHLGVVRVERNLGAAVGARNGGGRQQRQALVPLPRR